MLRGETIAVHSVCPYTHIFENQRINNKYKKMFASVITHRSVNHKETTLSRLKTKKAEGTPRALCQSVNYSGDLYYLISVYFISSLSP